MNNTRGIIMKANDEMYIVAGTIIKITDRVPKTPEERAEKPGSVIVRLAYDFYDGTKNEEIETDIVFWNSNKLRDNGTKYYQYGDHILNMRVKEGDILCTTIRPKDATMKVANGYYANYSRCVMPVLHPTDKKVGIKDENGDLATGVAIIAGQVTYVNDRVDKNGGNFLSIGVYSGNDKDGNYISSVVNVRNQTFKSGKVNDRISRAVKLLTPKFDTLSSEITEADGEKYEEADVEKTSANAIFLCDSPYQGPSNDGSTYTSWNVSDFWVIGSRSKTEHKKKKL